MVHHSVRGIERKKGHPATDEDAKAVHEAGGATGVEIWGGLGAVQVRQVRQKPGARNRGRAVLIVEQGHRSGWGVLRRASGRPRPRGQNGGALETGPGELASKGRGN